MASDAKRMFDQIDFGQKVDNEEQAREKCEFAFRYFYHLNKSSRIIGDTKALTALNFLLTHADHRLVNEIIQFGIKFDAQKVFIAVLENIFQRLIKFYTQSSNNSDGYTDEQLIRNKIGTLVVGVMTINLTEKYTQKSIKFCKKFQQDNGVRILFNILNNRKIQEHFVKSTKHQTGQEFILLKNLLRSILFCLYNLSKFSLGFAHKWKECNAVKNFLFYFEKNTLVMDVRINIGLSVANVVDEHDLVHALDSANYKEIFTTLARMVSITSKKIKNRIDLNRVPVELDETPNTRIVECCVVDYKETSWHFITILNAVYNLAQTNELRYCLYVEHKFEKYLREVIIHGNDVEVEYSLMLLWQFCYDRLCAGQVIRNDELNRHLTRLASEGEIRKKALAKGVLFLCKMYLREISVKMDRIHLAFSCDKLSEEMCCKIETELVHKYKYKVIIITNETDLAVKSQTIENCICLFPILSAHYKHSVVCRSDVEYAVHLSKKVVPILPNSQIFIDGWLDEMKSQLDEPIVEFNKSFVDGFSQLLSRIESIYKDYKLDDQIAVDYSKPQDVLKWKEQDVSKWVRNKNFHPHIGKSLSSCNGLLLKEIFEISLTAPSYLYDVLFNDNPEENARTPESIKEDQFNFSHFTYFKKELLKMFGK